MATANSIVLPTALTGNAKLKDVTRLIDQLADDLQTPSLLPDQRDAFLEQVKVYGRDPTNSDPIFTKKGINTLTRYAFDSTSPTTSRNALRCLANALLLREDTRQIFVDLGYEQKACEKLNNDSRDDEFLVSRIIFLTTYGTNIDIPMLVDQYHLADSIAVNVSRHAEQEKQTDPMTDMALIETVKLMFNLTYHCPERTSSFLPVLPHLLTILTKRPLPSKPLEPPIGQLINSVMNLEVDSKDGKGALFPQPSPTVVIDRMVEILDKSIQAYPDQELEANASPLLMLLRKTYGFAPLEVQTHAQSVLLPSEEDREEILGRSGTLPSRLLRLSTNPLTPKLRDSVSSLLFELSGKDATKFVENVGYGYASGFLFTNKDSIEMPRGLLETCSMINSKSSHPQASQGFNKDLLETINPVTGQYRKNEKQVDMPEMTEEEKEREAEKLFVLFERLKKTGVMDVKNPVEALREGRVQELDDDADE